MSTDATDSGPAIRAVRDEDELAELYDRILRPSFPAAELSPLDELVVAARRGRWRVLGARREPDGPWLGAAVVESFDCGQHLLVYLAVDAHTRSTGVGRALLDAARAVAAGAPFLLAEIEPPGAAAEQAVFGDPARRAVFYHRAGARALALDHWQPPVSAGMPFVPLRLICLPTATPLADCVDRAPVAAFEREYHGRDHASRELASTMASLGSGVQVPLLDLSELYRPWPAAGLRPGRAAGPGNS